MCYDHAIIDSPTLKLVCSSSIIPYNIGHDIHTIFRCIVALDSAAKLNT